MYKGLLIPGDRVRICDGSMDDEATVDYVEQVKGEPRAGVIRDNGSTGGGKNGRWTVCRGVKGWGGSGLSGELILLSTKVDWSKIAGGK